MICQNKIKYARNGAYDSGPEMRRQILGFDKDIKAHIWKI